MNKKQIIYQISLRTFTPEGTLRAAEEMIPFLAENGFDILYLCALFREDDDPDKQSWSKRQIESGYENPKNPYKTFNYYEVDDEYGTMDDLSSFIFTAHQYGLKVMLDLVYLHLGRRAPILEQHPEYAVCDENNKPIVADVWPFARWNFDNPSVTDYLCEHMRYLACEIGADAFRCDAGDHIPVTFWREAIRRIKKVKPDIMMMNEGASDEILSAGFDVDYRSYEMFENHDIASDLGNKRLSMTASDSEYRQRIFLLYAKNGIPFVWNGNEIADNSIQNMFSNRFYGRNNSINWSLAIRKRGKDCLALVKFLNEFYHYHAAFSSGESDQVCEKTNGILCCEHNAKINGEKIVALWNPSPNCSKIDKENYDVLFSESVSEACDQLHFYPWGFAFLTQKR